VAYLLHTILLKIIAVAGTHAFMSLKSDPTQFSGLISLTIDRHFIISLISELFWR